MTELRKDHFPILAASMGRNNPIPNLISKEDQHATAAIDKQTVSKEESKYMGFARVASIHPYTIQNGYNRIKTNRKFESYVLENEHLKARFLPNEGGRLWSLYDKDAQKELLHVNPVFQPCNLALRNAWISGGVEWNVGIIGHTPFTLDKMFVRTKKLSDGTPVLSMYQYERVRKLLYRVEAFLPAGSKQLYVRVRIDNPLDVDTVVYWWSNIAVDEGKDVRVIVPAKKAFHFHADKLSKVDVPHYQNKDHSYATNIQNSMDFFFDIPKEHRKYIAALNKDGYGLVQCSTNVLQGRKLFVWGQAQGGRNWQTYLSKKGSAYIEIQAGLAKTQLEHLPMAKRQSISWLEAYGALQANKKKIHDNNWDAAVQEVTDKLDKKLSLAELEAIESKYIAELNQAEGWSMLKYADGYAYLESRVSSAFDCCGLQFPSHQLGMAKEWKALLDEGALSEKDPAEAPQSYQAGEDWLQLLSQSITKKKGKNWYSLYQQAVLFATLQRKEEAMKCFEKSIALRPSAWAYACLALLEEKEQNLKKAMTHITKALELQKDRFVALEALRIHNCAEEYSKTIALYDALPSHIKALGRAKVHLITACIAAGELARADKMINKPFVIADIREGELSLSDMWFDLHIKKSEQSLGRSLNKAELAKIYKLKVPVHLDYRTHNTES